MSKFLLRSSSARVGLLITTLAAPVRAKNLCFVNPGSAGRSTRRLLARGLRRRTSCRTISTRGVYTKTVTLRACRTILAAILSWDKYNLFVHGDSDYASLVSSYSAALVEQALTMEGTGTTSDADRVRILRKVLEEAGLLSVTEGVMSTFEMRAYVRKHCAHLDAPVRPCEA